MNEALAGLGRLDLGAGSLDVTLRQIATLAKDTVTGVDATSMTMMENGRARTVVFTSPLAVQLDERQYADGFGPCMDAAITGQTVTVDTQDPETSGYPGFSALAARVGVHHSVSVGLPMLERVIGALNIYGSADLPFTGPAVELAQTFAACAAVAVSNASGYHNALSLAAQLQTAMNSRAVIEQAKGMIMAERGCDAAQAFAILADASQQQNLKLHEVAHQLIQRRSSR